MKILILKTHLCGGLSLVDRGRNGPLHPACRNLVADNDSFDIIIPDRNSKVSTNTNLIQVSLNFRNQRKELELFNEMLERRQKEVEKYRNKVLYANQITEDFFGQFNKESR